MPEKNRSDADLLESILGCKVAHTIVLSQPWETETRTIVVRFDRQPPIVVQWTSDRRGMARRIRLGRELYRRTPWIPTAGVLDGDARAVVPFMISKYIPGQSGMNLMLGGSQAAALCGGRMGSLARELRHVPIDGLRLSLTWSDADRLGAAARKWLANSANVLDPMGIAAIDELLTELPRVFARVVPVFAHGDFAPANVVIRRGEVVALLDFERARLAHPLFDAAWFRLIVGQHHPKRMDVALPAFLESAGIVQSSEELATLDLLAVLQCLERIDGTSRSQISTRKQWAARALVVLDSVLGRNAKVT